MPVSKLKDILNKALPLDITIKEAVEVADDFHARFSIKKKCYLYKIYNGENKNSFLARRMAHIYKELDIELMKDAACLIVGKHDFHGFCSSNTCATDFVRQVFEIDVRREDDFIFVSVCGSGFLYNMVRIIVGSLVDYALGKISLQDIKIALEKGDRARAGQTMPACGLYLKETFY